MNRKTPKQNARRRSRPQPNAALKMLVAGIFIGSFYFFFVATSESKEPVRNIPRTTETFKPKALQALPIATKPDPLPQKSELRALRAAGFKNIKFGVKSLTLNENEGLFKIPFSFKSRKQWCVGGDIDTMRLLASGDEKNDFIVTIEPITDGSRGEAYPVSIDKMVSGFEKSFAIKSTGKTENLGLFICSDRRGTKSCRGKESIDHKSLSDKIADPKTVKSTSSKDYILYFQNLVIRESKLFTYSSENVSEDGLSDLKKHIMSSMKIKASDFDSAQQFNKTMRSVPADIMGQRIALTLPYNDPRCIPGNGP
ncbi:MAG: hypothetical protein EOP04_02155 [Proteobacteria bacterium]|nr:MAG: hypothetical protein EOP04_02155 [Pseudomonadota bacterium]